MKKISILVLLSILTNSNVFAQPAIQYCPLNPRSIFELTINISLYVDSTGKEQNQSQLYAIDEIEMFYKSERNKTAELAEEDCTPYDVFVENNQLYISEVAPFESTINSNKLKTYLLATENIHSLVINITNSTGRTINLSQLPLLRQLKLTCSHLTIYCNDWTVESNNIKLDIKKWKFLSPKNVTFVRLHGGVFPKKKLLRKLRKFENITKIEFY